MIRYPLSGEMSVLSRSGSRFDVPWQTEETDFDPIKHPSGQKSRKQR
jgi:hypothetical protein